MNIDKSKYKEDFPIFRTYPGLVYLDSAATAQKPQVVIDAIVDFYTKKNANVHRGIHKLSEDATTAFEAARESVARFLGVNSSEVIFTSGTTASSNMITLGYLSQILQPEDTVITSVAEHHSNLLPIQKAAQQVGATLKLLGISEDSHTDLAALTEICREQGGRVKAVALSAVSNVLGIKSDLDKIIEVVRKHSPEALIILDAAQSIGHQNFKISDYDLDFIFFSGHKVLAETGVGVLWGKAGHLKKMQPAYLGGGMIDNVTKTTVTFAEAPAKFEAGTPHISGAISLGAAVDYLDAIGMGNVENYLEELTEYLLLQLSGVEGVMMLGPDSNEARLKAPLASFYIQNIHPHDIAQYLADMDIAVRAGHHCAQILHREEFIIPGSVRISLHIYNDKQDIDRLITALRECVTFFKGNSLNNTRE